MEPSLVERAMNGDEEAFTRPMVVAGDRLLVNQARLSHKTAEALHP